MAGDLAVMRLKAPWWLLLLAVIPALVALSWRRLNRQELRPWFALGLRVLGVAVLALALAEPFFARASKAMTVLFVLDRSLSIPEELGDDPANAGNKIDLRSLRLRQLHQRRRRACAGPATSATWPGLSSSAGAPAGIAPQRRAAFQPRRTALRGGRQLHRHRRRLETGPRLVSRGHRQAHRPDQRRQREPGQRRGAGPPGEDAQRADRRGPPVGRPAQHRGSARRARRCSAVDRAGRPRAHPRPRSQPQPQHRRRQTHPPADHRQRGHAYSADRRGRRNWRGSGSSRRPCQGGAHHARDAPFARRASWSGGG